jgi:hypothetical protein
MGHAIFLETGLEKNNVIENNLVMTVERSTSLLNSDMSPSAFWMSNPDNILRGNHAAGALNSGFLLDFPWRPEGPTIANVVGACPEGMKLGEFSDNEAHSNRYGLLIYEDYVPR